MLSRLSSQVRQLSNRPYLRNYLAQTFIFLAAGTGAFLLRFEFRIPAYYQQHLLAALPIWVLSKLVVFHLASLDRRWWKFFSLEDAFRLVAANFSGSVLSALMIALYAPSGFPRSIAIIDMLLATMGTAAVFLSGRTVNEVLRGRKKSTTGRDVLIYGAGRAGVALAGELRANRALDYRVRGFIDDDPNLSGMYVQGLPVMGAGCDMADAVRRTGVAEILIAVPSATGEQMLRILGFCSEAGVKFRTMATLAEIVEGKALASQMRDVDVQDLLCRTQARLDHDQIRDKVESRVVMITGAAGSIGSELCRQVARFRPRMIVGFDIAETALFHLEREMRAKFPEVVFHPEIGSVQNAARVGNVMSQYHPSVIFHAAAYKHVPMMERSLFEAIENNVLGTYNVAMAAQQHDVDHFVLISTDKAVRPTSVMGATKRMDELMILSLQGGRTRYTAVRFGNVLGSNGSVIPLFKEQIAAGGPVTVTHPEMRRYFMTIPEAAQLVIQASAMGEGGEIFVLDMGPQLKIVDLAKNLILLSGLRPGVDIQIQFSGTRPGEKLYEELSLDDEETVPTRHPKIKIFSGNGLPDGDMTHYIEELRQMVAERDARGILLLLKELVPEYNPSNHLLRQLLGARGPQVETVAQGVRAANAALRLKRAAGHA